MDSFPVWAFFLAGTIQPKTAFSYKAYAKNPQTTLLFVLYFK